MSGARPETPEERQSLAGEYVLGVLGAAEMRAVQDQATADPTLARDIAGWERRFGPMLSAVAEVPPPDALWARIQHGKSRLAAEAPRLRPVPTLVRPPAEPAWMPPPPRRVWPWKVTTAFSLALAAALAAIMLVPTLAHAPPVATQVAGTPAVAAPGGREIALLAMLTQPDPPTDATRQDASAQMAADSGIGKLVEPSAADAAAHISGFLAATWPDGTVLLTAFAPVAVPAGKALELWIEPPGAKAPTSLGVLPAGGRQVVLPAAAVPGTSLSVTLEPAGGSPSGGPSGRVLYAGTLRPVRP